MRAALKGDIEKTKNLIRQGCNPNSKTKNGYTPLMGAAMNGHLNVVKFLISAGANTEIRFKDGRTALFGAVRQGYRDVVKILLEAGADPNLQENNENQTPLHMAADQNHAAIIEELIEYGADTEVREKHGGYTPLFFAVFKGHYDAVLSLLACGADPYAEGNEGEKIFDLANSIGDEEIIDILQYVYEEDKEECIEKCNKEKNNNTFLDEFTEVLKMSREDRLNWALKNKGMTREEWDSNYGENS